MTFGPNRILVIGAGRGLGFALVEECLRRFPQAEVLGTYRRRDRAQQLLKSSASSFQIDPINESEVAEFVDKLGGVDLFINAVGVLHDEVVQPEKSLKDISIEKLTYEFQVNAFITPLWGKYLKKKLSTETPSVFATLSAMVGSIGENEIGGWYGYRASKTALNMFLKTMAIEFERSRLKTSVVGIHPGTTYTGLSEPFLKGIKHKVWEPDQAAQNILNVLVNCPKEGTGLFKNWDGRTIAW